MQMRNKSESHLLLLICIIMLIAFAKNGNAQTKRFTETDNAVKNLHVNSNRISQPCLVDINNDGKIDLFSGEYNYKNGTVVNSSIYFYNNNGQKNTPSFQLADATRNPLNNISIPGLIIPRFVDIDGDGDKDCFIANSNGGITFMLNTGSAVKPVFEKQSAAFNPLSMVKFQGLEISNFAFADMDNDGDIDGIVTNNSGDVAYFENSGSRTNPSFKTVNSNKNPFTFLRNTDIKSISFFDWNNDGFPDLFVNNIYYQNNSDRANIAFIKNPLNAPIINDDEMLSPNWMIANNKITIIAGNQQGNFNYFMSDAAKAVVTNINTRVYPNPSNKSFTIYLPETSGEKCIKITDANGRLISMYKINNTNIVTGQSLLAGTYFLQVFVDNNEVSHQKIIKL